MYYKSTRNSDHQVTAAQAILAGLAPDGGLYVPVEFPKLDIEWEEFSQLSYQDMSFVILKPWLSDFSDDQLREAITAAYNAKNFDHPSVAPVRKVGRDYFLELFHGNTIAFKDMALSILPHLMRAAKVNCDNDQKILILTATSGDTGKAAMASFADVADTQIIVFYPKGGISSIQEKQMISQKGDNTHVVAIFGNFDHAQTKIKEIFNNQEVIGQLAEEGIQFSSANSMNIGRLLPQIIYYYYAYAQLIKQNEIEIAEAVDFTVPTGNFGNILAGYYAKQMGLPIGNLICASNDNSVLFDFFKSGEYNKNRPFYQTLSPSMDILVSSNFERLVYHALGEDSEKLVELMRELELSGKYTLAEEYQNAFDGFLAAHITDLETKTEIRKVFDRDIYLIDPHTAVASAAMRRVRETHELKAKQVIVSTASPYKFPEAILSALNINIEDKTDKQALQLLQDIIQSDFPRTIHDVLTAESKHYLSVEVDAMTETVLDLALKNT